MFQILPLPPAELPRLTEDKDLSKTALPAAFRLSEDGIEKGFVAYCYDYVSKEARLLKIDYPAEDPALADALMRAVFNAAERAGAELCDVSAVMADPVLREFRYVSQAQNGRVRIADLFGHCPCGQ